MARSRALFALLAILTVAAQPWAGPACDCDSLTSDMDQMSHAATDTGDHDHQMGGDADADCDHERSVCDCDSCIQLHGIISDSAELLPDSVPGESQIPIHYVGPPHSPAFRPPILI
jgi:hypothetical protein